MTSEINDVAPSALKHLIGQRGVIEQVSVALEAAWADNKKMDSALLVGPPGLGKSALAHVIAAEMATELHEVLGQSLSCSAELNALLLGAKAKDVVHIDEAHELNRQFQTALYLAIDQRKLIVGTGHNGTQGIPIADFTLLLSTTDEYCLLQPLRDRMKLLLRFDYYAVKELATMVRHRVQALRWDVDDDVPLEIGRRSRGTPRIALRLLQSCHRVCRAENEERITCKHLERACQLEQLDRDGLDVTEQRYLSVLAEGPGRLNVLASLLGLPAKTVSEVIEPFLIRAGLVIKDDQGRRQLTAKGHKQLRRIAV